MPEFTNAFSGLKEGRMLTHDELVRAIRFMIAAEYESIQIYTQLAASIDHKLAQEVLWDISNEEKEHAGEFLRLLQVLARTNRVSTMKGWVKPMKRSTN